jgi:hypothetical protein
MTKVSRREAVGTLLGGIGCLVGTYLLGFKTPMFPEDCRWEPFPYDWCHLRIDGTCQDMVPGVESPPEESFSTREYPRRGGVTRR